MPAPAKPVAAEKVPAPTKVASAEKKSAEKKAAEPTKKKPVRISSKLVRDIGEAAKSEKNGSAGGQ